MRGGCGRGRQLFACRKPGALRAVMGASGVFGDQRICAAIVGHADLRDLDNIADYLDHALQLAR